MSYNIYMHISGKGSAEFDPQKMIDAQQKPYEDHMGSKRECDLWASPFTEKNAFTWEEFWYADTSWTESLARSQCKDSIAPKSEQQRAFEERLELNRLPIMDYAFYPASFRKQNKVIKESFRFTDPAQIMEYQKQIPVWAKVYEARENADRRWAQYGEDVQNFIRQTIADKFGGIRKNAFFFAVDQDKLLHVREMSDIEQFIATADEQHPYGQILYDKLQDAGYSGIELHNPRGLRYGPDGKQTVFYLWDVNSVEIWDPTCVKVIDREIACIARMARVDCTAIDLYDQYMNHDNLKIWMANNPDAVKNATHSGILSAKDVHDVQHCIYNTWNARAAIEKSINSHERQEYKEYKIELSRTLEQDLAKYCVEEKVRPILLKGEMPGTHTGSDTFDVLEWADLEDGFIAKMYNMADGSFACSGEERNMFITPGCGIDHMEEGFVFETADGKNKILFSNIDFSEEYRIQKAEWEEAHPYRRKEAVLPALDTEGVVPTEYNLMSAPTNIIDLSSQRAAAKELLAQKCIETGKAPGNADNVWAIGGEKMTLRFSMMEPGMQIKGPGQDFGDLIETYHDQGLRLKVLETDTHIVTVGEYMDFSHEYGKTIKERSMNQEAYEQSACDIEPNR